MNLQPLELRRKIADALCAYDLFNLNINDPNLNNKLIRTDYTIPLRNMRIFVEPYFRQEYLRAQPIVRLIHLINFYNEIFTNSQGKNSFKTKILNKLTEINETDEN